MMVSRRSSIQDLKAESSEHLRLFNIPEGPATPALQNVQQQYFVEEVVTAPIFSLSAHLALIARAKNIKPENEKEDQLVFPQYGVLGSQLTDHNNKADQSSLIYTNVSAPWSAFICGSQGSGKSHTLSCLLENSLMSPSPTGKLNNPLSALVMHYDKFTSHASTQLCEAAYLCSSVKVRVLVSPTNELAMRSAYGNMLGQTAAAGGSRLRVMPMYLPKRGLTISMMKTLMGVSSKDTQPLYMDMVMKILRDMAIETQGRESFDYNIFKTRINQVDWVKGQAVPLFMRLAVLESFFEPDRGPGLTLRNMPLNTTDNLWRFEPGTLTIIDLSCPFVGADDACALFNIALSLFLKDRRRNLGRVLALDEAHKFLGSTSPEAANLTDTLLSIVRQQRHLATRVVIATQEPTISPDFIDLCNFTMIHRFSSPTWFQTIRSHLAGAGVDNFKTGKAMDNELFRRIVELKTGQALLFCPTGLLVSKEKDGQESEDDGNLEKWMVDSGWGTPMAVNQDGKNDDIQVAVGAGSSDEDLLIGKQKVVHLGSGYIHIQIRNRITLDGGRSIIAS